MCPYVKDIILPLLESHGIGGARIDKNGRTRGTLGSKGEMEHGSRGADSMQYGVWSS